VPRAARIHQRGAHSAQAISSSEDFDRWSARDGDGSCPGMISQAGTMKRWLLLMLALSSCRAVAADPAAGKPDLDVFPAHPVIVRVLHGGCSFCFDHIHVGDGITDPVFSGEIYYPPSGGGFCRGSDVDAWIGYHGVLFCGQLLAPPRSTR